MPIRTEAEHRSALSRLDGEKAIMRSRSFTDDEQRDFDALTAEIAAYEKGRSPWSGGAASTTLPPRSPMPQAAASHPVDPSASMRRELERQGLAQHQSGTASMSTTSMQRELKRAGLTPAARG